MDSFFEPFQSNYEEKLYDFLSKVMSRHKSKDIYFFNSYSFLVINSLIRSDLLAKKFENETGSNKNEKERTFVLVYFSGGGSEGSRVFDNDFKIVEDTLEGLKGNFTYSDVYKELTKVFFGLYKQDNESEPFYESWKRLLLTPLFEGNEDDKTKYKKFIYYSVSLDYSLPGGTNKVDVYDRLSIPILFNIVTLFKDHEHTYRLFVSPDHRIGDMKNVQFILEKMLDKPKILSECIKREDYKRKYMENGDHHCLEILECNRFLYKSLGDCPPVARLYPPKSRYNGLFRLDLIGNLSNYITSGYTDNFGSEINFRGMLENIERHFKDVDRKPQVLEKHPLKEIIGKWIFDVKRERDENTPICILIDGPLDLYGVYLIHENFRFVGDRLYLFASCVVRSVVYLND